MTDPITTRIFVHNTIEKVMSTKVLMFLQPLETDANYLYSAWNVLNPGPGSTQHADLTTSFKASISEFASKHGDYSDPVDVPLGKSLTISDLHDQSATITSVVHAALTGSQVGLFNDTQSPPTDLSVVWYVNGNKVVETNNADDTVLSTGLSSTFELKQSVYLMLGEAPKTTTTYVAQTFSDMTEIKVPNGAAELHILLSADAHGIPTFAAVSQAEFDRLQKQAALAYAQHQRAGALLAENAALGGSAQVGIPTPYGIVDVSVLDPSNGRLLDGGIGTIVMDNGTVISLNCMTFAPQSQPVVGKAYVISGDRLIAGPGSTKVPFSYTFRCTVSGPNSHFIWPA